MRMDTAQNNSLPQSDVIKNDDELQELLNDGISVWGQYQCVVEKQALSHFESLTEEKNETEDGEILEDDDKVEQPIFKVNRSLDINEFIARQEQLRQNYIEKKLSNVSERSKNIAKNISKRQISTDIPQNKCSKRKRKRKHSANVEKQQEKNVKCSFEISSSLPQEIDKQTVSENEPISIETPSCSKSSECTNEITDEIRVNDQESGSEYYPSENEHNSDSDYQLKNCTVTSNEENKKKKTNVRVNISRLTDDAILEDYKKRLKDYNHDNSHEDYIVGCGLKVPGELWSKLFDYQQEGVEWLWNLHKKDVGGLLGDEMGLGKTVQIIAFLAALQYSQLKDYPYIGLGPVLIVCPVTVVHQWVKHFHTWWPPFRIVLLHSSSTHSMKNKSQLIRSACRDNSIIITNYESVLKYKGNLLEQKWHYIILDEGHKIRNTTAKITIAVKQFRGTNHRLMLTGSPMQNNLLELWSLFDFIVPGRLGTQQVFVDHFATPIIQGGYTNATQTQETTALLIATSLKDMITPYMLRRSKNDVGDSILLPEKSEQVLFCSLTDEQRDLYRGYLLSDHVGSILGRTSGPRCVDYQKRANMLVAITILRKICNHPDLYLGEANDYGTETKNDSDNPQYIYGHYKRSGKMIVVAALLKIWKRQGHRVLLFTQGRAMIEIFEDMLKSQEYTFLKMDGTTTISSRQPLIDKFNQDTSYDVFLLTTKVGGLGVNLTGANRVIIYDPDWNPATDLQARERAWRIGQLRQVTVYRLVTGGTIEEKMYQRQVWKQLLSNKVLLDPRTHRFFKSSDLNELFSLQEPTDTNPETANIFRNSKVEVDINKKKSKPPDSNISIEFSEDKIQAMKNRAQEIAKKLSKNNNDNKNDNEEKGERPTPVELLEINRKKLEPKPPEPIVNKIDEIETKISFSTALEIATDTKKMRRLQRKEEKKRKEDDRIKESKKKKKKHKEKVKVDKSGKLEGEKVEGLLKIEFKKKEKRNDGKLDNQDDYVLGKLLTKKGVQTALQHDVIVQSGYKSGNSLKVHYEAKHKAEMALNALRKSKLNAWRY